MLSGKKMGMGDANKEKAKKKTDACAERARSEATTLVDEMVRIGLVAPTIRKSFETVLALQFMSGANYALMLTASDEHSGGN